MPPAKKLATTEHVQAAAAVAALTAAKATADEAEAGNNKFIQAQAKQLLERIDADKAALATDEPSGIEVIADRDFLKQDPTDPAPRLAQKGLEYRKDRRYHWINTDPRRMQRRTNQGWLPVEGGAIKNGDSVLAEMPETRAKAMERQLDERRRIQRNAHTDQLAHEGRRNNMEVFNGDKSLRDGLD